MHTFIGRFATLTLSLILLLSITAPSFAQDETPADPTINGGQAATPGQFTFMARVGNDCNGVLIDEQWILTAYHCYNSIQNALNADVTLGDHRFYTQDHPEDAEQVIPVLKAFRGPETTDIPCPSTVQFACDNDVLLLQLAYPATLNSRVQPIAYNDDPTFRDDGRATLIGWGGTCFGCPSQDELRYYETDVNGPMDRLTQVNYGEIDDDGNYNPANGLCSGDSGGPAVKQDTNGDWVLLGTTSFSDCSTDRSWSTDASLTADWLDNMIADTGKLTIIKEALPEDGTDFRFALTNNKADSNETKTVEFILDDDDDHTFQNYFTTGLLDGIYSIEEFQSDAWLLDEVVCDSDNVSVDLELFTIDVTMVNNEDVTCTFKNKKPSELGTLTIAKNVDFVDGTDFEFTYDGPGSIMDTVILDVDNETDPTNPGAKLLTDLPTGQYSITETPIPGWRLTNVICDVDESLYAVDLTTNTVELILEAQTEATCTFENEKLPDPKFTLVKSADPRDGTDFQFEVVFDDGGLPNLFGIFTLDDSLNDDGDAFQSSQEFSLLPNVLYSFNETVPEGWELTDVVCDLEDPNKLTNNGISVSVTLDYEDDVTCTFYNEGQPTAVSLAKSTTDFQANRLVGSLVLAIAAILVPTLNKLRKRED